MAISAAAIIGLTAGAALAETPAKARDSALGKVLADAKGMTLYTFANDTAGKSMCNGPCATAWPPLAAAAAAKPEGGFTIIARDDGSKQWAHKGMPLYFYAQDKKPGDTTGENIRNVWKVARP